MQREAKITTPLFQQGEQDTAGDTKKTNFASDVLILIGGTTFAQIITILASPVLTRIFGPEAYGLLAVFNSITGVIIVISCLRYELSIMLPKEDGDAANLFALSLLIVTAISGVTALCLLIGHHSLILWLNVPELDRYYWLIPVAIFLGGLFLPFNYWDSRKKQYQRLSIARVNRSVTTVGVQMGGGIAGFAGGGGLIAGYICGIAASTLTLGFQIFRDDRHVFTRSIQIRKMIAGLKRYRNFPIYDTWAGLLSSISSQLPIFILASFFTSTVVGYYSLGMMVLQLPVNFIGMSIAQVFFQRAAELKNESMEKLSSLVQQTMKTLTVIGIYPILLLIFAGSDLFVFVFGGQWAEAGFYSQLLAIWIFCVFITSPLSSLMSVLEKQRFSLGYNIFSTTVRGGALIAGGLSGNPRIAILSYSIVGVVTYGMGNVLFMHWVQVSIREFFRSLIKYLLLCLPLWGLVIAVQVLSPHQPALVAASALISTGIYYLVIYMVEDTFSSIVRSVWANFRFRGD